MTDDRPKVGLAVLIKKDGKFLFMKRKGSHGEGTWAPPGGHIEFGETFVNCAKREVFEETGVEIKNVKLLSATEEFYENERLHYVTIFMNAELKKGRPMIKEIDKCTALEWFHWGNLPRPLFSPVKHLLAQKISP